SDDQDSCDNIKEGEVVTNGEGRGYRDYSEPDSRQHARAARRAQIEIGKGEQHQGQYVENDRLRVEQYRRMGLLNALVERLPKVTRGSPAIRRLACRLRFVRRGLWPCIIHAKSELAQFTRDFPGEEFIDRTCLVGTPEEVIEGPIETGATKLLLRLKIEPGCLCKIGLTDAIGGP